MLRASNRGGSGGVPFSWGNTKSPETPDATNSPLRPDQSWINLSATHIALFATAILVLLAIYRTNDNDYHPKSLSENDEDEIELDLALRALSVTNYNTICPHCKPYMFHIAG